MPWLFSRSASPIPDRSRISGERDRAGRQHDLAFHLRPDEPPVLAVEDRDRPSVLHIDAFDERCGLHLQVRSLQRRPQEPSRRAPAPAALLVHLEIGRAGIVAGVEVVDLGDTSLFRRVAHSVQEVPAQARIFHPPLAAPAVHVVGRPLVVLVFHEHRQHVVPAPAGQSHLAPAVVVARLATHVDHGVDGRGAAQHLAARIGELAPVEPRLGLRAEQPVRARVADGEEIADRDVEPDPVVAPAAFDKQHAVPGIGGKAIRQHAARRAGAGNDVVELAFERLIGLRHLTCNSPCRAKAPAPARPPAAAISPTRASK